MNHTSKESLNDVLQCAEGGVKTSSQKDKKKKKKSNRSVTEFVDIHVSQCTFGVFLSPIKPIEASFRELLFLPFVVSE